MTEAENFNRLVRLIAKGGTMVIRELLNKYSPHKKFMDYLYNNQGLLDKLKAKLTDKEKDLVSNMDFYKMDITLLCKLALNIFKDKMTTDETTYLGKIKRERDSFLHSDILEICMVDHLFFSRKWQYISTALEDMALEIGGADLRREIEIVIKDTEKSSPTFSEIQETLTQFCGYNKELSDKVEQLCKAVEELKGCYTII